jgi:hypothetical protein
MLTGAGSAPSSASCDQAHLPANTIPQTRKPPAEPCRIAAMVSMTLIHGRRKGGFIVGKELLLIWLVHVNNNYGSERE